MGVSVLLAFKKLQGHFTRNKKLPGSAEKFPLQMEGVVPKPHHQTFHANASIGILLPAMGTEFCLIGQGMVTIAAVAFQGE